MSFSSPVIWVILFTILFVTTLLNGIYPALTLSSFRPMNFLKGIGFLKIKGGNLRRGLVVFQFAMSTTLIAYVMIIYAQMNYIQQKDRGYNHEHVISIKTPFYADNTLKLQMLMSKLQSVKTAWITHFPNDPFEYSFLDDSFNNQYKTEIKNSYLMLLFSVLAIVIALLGLLGLSTFAVERRFKEIGIRKILGASVNNIVFMLAKEFLILVGIAMFIAFPLAYFWANKMLQDFTYRISIGWWMFAVAGIITVLLTLIIVGWRTVKAAMANPVKAIKAE